MSWLSNCIMSKNGFVCYYNNSVGDVYEVSGQAIKSVTWFTTKGKLLEKFTSRHNAGHCIVKKGGNFKTP